MSLDKGKMPKIDASGYRYAIAASRFNKELVDALVRDAVGTLHRCGVDAENIRLVRVPGAAELPHVCSLLAQTEQYDAIIALGVVVRGETPHHEIIAHSTAAALQKVALSTAVPMINGIIVANTREQAEARTKGEIARGKEFAEAAMEMAWQTALLLDELEEAEAEFGDGEPEGKGYASRTPQTERPPGGAKTARPPCSWRTCATPTATYRCPSCSARFLKSRRSRANFTVSRRS